MNIIKQSWEFMDEYDGERMLKKIERMGRTAYKSESRIAPKSFEKFIMTLVKSGHTSVLEHGVISIKIITSRAIANQIVRHRLASYTQESTRYCNYSNKKFGKQITVILPKWYYSLDLDKTIKELDSLKSLNISDPLVNQFSRWLWVMRQCEYTYFDLIKLGQKPGRARGVLPLDLKTELAMTANITEWRHILRARIKEDADPQIQEICLSILEGFEKTFPIIFNDVLMEKVVLDTMSKCKALVLVKKGNENGSNEIKEVDRTQLVETKE
jgi:thymidylate synthase (FAD)